MGLAGTDAIAVDSKAQTTNREGGDSYLVHRPESPRGQAARNYLTVVEADLPVPSLRSSPLPSSPDRAPLSGWQVGRSGATGVGADCVFRVSRRNPAGMGDRTVTVHGGQLGTRTW